MLHGVLIIFPATEDGLQFGSKPLHFIMAANISALVYLVCSLCVTHKGIHSGKSVLVNFHVGL